MRASRDQIIAAMHRAIEELLATYPDYEHVSELNHIELDLSFRDTSWKRILLQMEDDGIKFYDDTSRETGVNGNYNRT